jgi:hypothetical protein
MVLGFPVGPAAGAHVRVGRREQGPLGSASLACRYIERDRSTVLYWTNSIVDSWCMDSFNSSLLNVAVVL